MAGVYARVAARLLALAAGIWHNWRINVPRKRSLIAYDHYQSRAPRAIRLQEHARRIRHPRG
ncbi:hypothetical protein QF036_004984 [Arthrobacter globiformis]|nr:hypothetical protein [Arthrobacter globiformis]